LARLRDGLTPDVVLLDMQMPVMDGLKTLGFIRQMHPTLKVIMCSGVDDLATIEQAFLLGLNAYVTKPVRPLYLSAALERCLSEEPSEHPYSPGVISITLAPGDAPKA